MEGGKVFLEMFQALSFEAKRAIISSSFLAITAACLYFAGRNKGKPPKQK